MPTTSRCGKSAPPAAQPPIFRDASCTIVELPLPAPGRLSRTAAARQLRQFLYRQRLVLVPTFNDPNDRLALNILADLFPDREVVGIHCGDLIWGLGAIHCMTQQQPK